MPVTVHCPCNTPYRVRDELAGKTIACPYCKEAVSVPAQLDPPVYDDPYGSESQTGGSCDKMPSQFPSDSDRFSDSRFGSTADSPSYPIEQEQQYQPAEPEFPGYAATEQEAARKAKINVSSVMAGIGMMVGGGVWILGLGFDFYPIALFVFGLISLVKGLTGAED